MKKNKIIAMFMGYQNRVGYPHYDGKDMWLNKRGMGGHISSGAFDYYKDWNLLMAACKKWDDLLTKNKGKNALDWGQLNIDQYSRLSDWLDNAVSCYDIKKTFNQLVENIEWYNQTTFKK